MELTAAQRRRQLAIERRVARARATLGLGPYPTPSARPADPGRGTPRPYPFAELEAAAGGSASCLCRLLRISWATLGRLRSAGLSEEQADRFAVRLGLHPAEVWPGWLVP